MVVIFWCGLFCLYHCQSMWIDDSLSLIARWWVLFWVFGEFVFGWIGTGSRGWGVLWCGLFLSLGGFMIAPLF